MIREFGFFTRRFGQLNKMYFRTLSLSFIYLIRCFGLSLYIFRFKKEIVFYNIK